MDIFGTNGLIQYSADCFKPSPDFLKPIGPRSKRFIVSVEIYIVWLL